MENLDKNQNTEHQLKIAVSNLIINGIVVNEIIPIKNYKAPEDHEPIAVNWG